MAEADESGGLTGKLGSAAVLAVRLRLNGLRVTRSSDTAAQVVSSLRAEVGSTAGICL